MDFWRWSSPGYKIILRHLEAGLLDLDFSCVQTVVKLQLHSVLATLYLLAEEHFFSTSSLPDWEVQEGSLAAFAEVASVPSFPNMGLQSAPRKQPLSPCHRPWKRNHCFFGFPLLKDKAASYLCQFKYWLSFLPPSVKWGDSQNLQKDSIIHSL